MPPAILADAGELKSVPFDLESGLFGKSGFQLFEIAISEIGHCAAAGTDHVMVMAGGREGITAGLSRSIDAADESKLGEHFQGSIDGDKSNSGVLLLHALVHRRRGMVLVA